MTLPGFRDVIQKITGWNMFLEALVGIALVVAGLGFALRG
jgi:hypothetical protein